ncbi:hypothetical protein G7Z17_g11711 [Cylindrodendrum hubeiense]|uniref:Chromo domain-containing protein n=1 Tax=Cylindrodendrum hubeiense TaxID=595255 RepID=A0A9P5H095_9HYPO|nr:hypothetical protein G7Z17_g11711 [Cylindrodendrum hubeiense]
MSSFLGRMFSPRKHQPQAPELSEAQTPSKDKSLFREDSIRAQHALGRLSISDADRPHDQTTDDSIPAAEDDSIDDDHVPSKSDDDVDMTDAEPPVPPSASKFGLLSPQARRSARNSLAQFVEPGNDTEVPEEDDDDQQYIFTGILDHRWAGNAIEVKVAWEQGPATWEPEENLHRDAPKSLFAYWKAAGGRPLNPADPDLFVIFAIRKHSRNKKRLLVEWLGYDAKEMTWLPVEAVEETAGEVVAEYWKGLKKTK